MGRSREQPVTLLSGTVVIASTDKALLCKVMDEEPIWIPRSQIHDDSEVWEEGDEGMLVIPEWLARAKGID